MKQESKILCHDEALRLEAYWFQEISHHFP